jgi:uncharacterized protein
MPFLCFGGRWAPSGGTGPGEIARRNVEVVRTGYAAFNREDFEAVVELVQPEIEWDASEQFEGRVYHGHDGYRQYVQDVLKFWHYWRLEIEESHGRGDRVLIVGKVKAKDRRYGVPAEVRVAWVWTLRDGKGTHLRIYLDPDKGREVVGLRLSSADGKR